MDGKVNYTLVGIFVLSLLVGLISFTYWLTRYGDAEDYDNYHVYLTESVAGLSNDAAVKYRGVNVGTVVKIEIDPKNSEQVKLLLRVKAGTPVKMDTRAKLESFGITGLVFIQLTGGDKNTPFLETSGETIPVIPETASTFARIDETVSILSKKLALALDKFDALLSKDNVNQAMMTLEQVNLLAQDSRKQLHGIEKLIEETIIMEKNIVKGANEIGSASTSIKSLADSLEKKSTLLSNSLNQNMQFGVDSLSSLMNEFSLLAIELNHTTQAIKSSPSDLLFKKTLIRPGPGEEGFDNEH